jgi:hypothetical protein
MRALICSCPLHDSDLAKADPDWAAVLPDTYRTDLPDGPPIHARALYCNVCAGKWPEMIARRPTVKAVPPVFAKLGLTVEDFREMLDHLREPEQPFDIAAFVAAQKSKAK